MNIISRYVVAELTKIMGAALTVLTLLILIVGLVTEAMRRGLGPAQIIRLVPFILPDALRFTIPAASLLAVSLVYGRMSSSNEVVALKSAGISPMKILWPVFIAATILSCLSVWLNDIAVSRCFANMQRVAIEASEEIIYSVLRTQHSYSSKDVSINVRRVDGRTLVRPTVTLHQKENRPTLTILAESGEISTNLKEKTLKIQFHNFSVYGDGALSVRDAETTEIEIPLTSASRTQTQEVVPARMSLAEIPGKRTEHLAVLSNFRQLMAMRCGTSLLTGDFAELSGDEMNERGAELAYMNDYLARLNTEFPRRWAAGFSCLAFVVVGSATAIKRRSSDILTSFFVCFLPILILYYPLLAFGLDYAKNGTLPPCTVWLGNVILGVWGVVELRHVLRY